MGRFNCFQKIHKHLSPLDDQYSRLEHITSIVVGATDSCLLLWAWKQDFVVAITKEDALEKARKKTKNPL